jgi:hypothetical protein
MDKLDPPPFTVPAAYTEDLPQARLPDVVSALTPFTGPIGHFLVEIFGSDYQGTLLQRRESWWQSLAEALRELRERVKGLEPENLIKNEVFNTVLIRATVVAAQEHSKVKLDSLRNAALNSALPYESDNSKVLLFNLVERFTEIHILLLRVYEQQPRYQNSPMTKPIDYFDLQKEDGAVLESIARDLARAGLIYATVPGRSGEAFVDVNHKALQEPSRYLEMIDTFISVKGDITALGTRFLAFIRDPRETRAVWNT